MSQAKHYCNYCKGWCQGSKESIGRHEEGNRHKERVAQILKKKRSGPGNAPDERELQKQLAEIEAAARASMGASQRGERGAFAGDFDAAFTANQGYSGSFDERGRGYGAPTSWPGMNEDGGHRERPPEWAGSTWQMPRAPPGAGEGGGEEEEEEAPAVDDDGVYVARGITYFAGGRHPDKLRTRGKCEVWDEATEAWLPAAIVKVKRHASGEGVEIRTFDVKVVADGAPPAAAGPPSAPPPPDAPPAAWDAWRRARERAARPAAPLSRTAEHLRRTAADVVLTDVVAKDLRVAGLPDGTYAPDLVDVGGADAPPPESVERAAPNVTDESTGLGQWRTISVRQVDDAAEAAAANKADKKRRKEDAYHDRKERRAADDRAAAVARATDMCAREDAADALSSQLSANDRTDEYRGVKLADDSAARALERPPPARERDPAAPPPAFKKRKVTAKFRKKA